MGHEASWQQSYVVFSRLSRKLAMPQVAVTPCRTASTASEVFTGEESFENEIDLPLLMCSFLSEKIFVLRRWVPM